MYNVTIPDEILEKKSIIFPISMNQPLERGEQLKATLAALKKISSETKASITILVCDYLNRHNVGEKKSLEMGDNFIKENKHLFSGFEVLRWKSYVESLKDFNSTLLNIEKKSSEKSLFYGKMRKVHDNCRSSFSLSSSIAYQREEFSVILLMNLFDAIIYPKKPSSAMSYLYSNIEGKKPDFINFKITQKKLENKHSLFKKPKAVHMHVAFRVLLEQVNSLLESPEISSKSKIIFIEKLKEDINFISEYKLKEKEKFNLSTSIF